MEYDNNEGSTRLLDSIEEKVDKDAAEDIKKQLTELGAEVEVK